MSPYQPDEKHLSQIPALQLLANLGYTILPPDQALAERQGKAGHVLLENILREQLKKINQIQYKGGTFLFSEENIQSAIQKLKAVKYDGLLRTNETMYDLLTLGVAMEQSIEGDTKSFTLNYIDWKNWANNDFHVSPEFAVERSRSHDTARPDLVLFVNGIPLAVIECKAPSEKLAQAVSQSIRNQGGDYIPKLFTSVQLVMGINKNAATYGTVGTGKDFWSEWKEMDNVDDDLSSRVNTPLSPEEKDKLFTGPFAAARSFFDGLDAEDRLVTGQDRALHSLCRPERLLELAYRFTLFDAGVKKMARYQQYYVVKSTLQRIKQKDGDGRRQGGIIWHTQGSGKSLTMVMLARSLALDTDIPNPRIVLVTDRRDLDDQLGNTFAACGLKPKQARSGGHLLELVAEHQADIITTLVHKFGRAMKTKKFQDDSPDIFMLVDESHRSQFGPLAARMRQMFPRACYIGFTGTPLMKEEKNNFVKFGGLIEPHYPIGQAVDDGAVIPLLYEGRLVEMEQNKHAIDLWFGRHTKGLTREQQADLKRKYARAEMLNKTEQVVYMRAYDISEHYRKAWQGTGFKAQLVAPDRPTAIQYHEYLQELGQVTSEVIISGPDTRDGYDEVDEEPSGKVAQFWKKMMTRFGNSEDEYNRQIINQFKHGDEPEILIVVSKLITGFDAPRNAVMYLCKEMKEHTLLQAIARVNRVYEHKEFGYIVDYVGLLGELDDALTMYDAFDGFDEDDLLGTLTSIQVEIDKLPQRYSDLWDVFKEVKQSKDEEAYEQLLADEALRAVFYKRLAEFSRSLAIALSSERFIHEVDEQKIDRYKTDLKRFHKLKASVKLRYAESINYRDYEPKIRKLLDTHIQANEVIQVNEPVNIFDESSFRQVKEEQGVYTTKRPAAKADAIAHSMKKVATEKMDEDPAFYEKFSKLIQQAIDEFREKLISGQDYLAKVTKLRNDFIHHRSDDIPTDISENGDAVAYFGVLAPFFETNKPLAVQCALAIDSILKDHRKVHFWDDEDAKKQAENAIDDFLYDEVKGKEAFPITVEHMDTILEKVMRIAEHRAKSGL